MHCLMQKSVSIVNLSIRVNVKCERSRGVGTNQATLEGTVALQQISTGSLFRFI